MTELSETINVTMSDSAAKRINEIIAAGSENTALRVSVEGGGCSGFQYKFDLVKAAEEEDLVIEKLGAKILIDPTSLTFMDGSEIDFVDGLIGQSFQVKNPNVTAACGCGTSFTV